MRIHTSTNQSDQINQTVTKAAAVVFAQEIPCSLQRPILVGLQLCPEQASSSSCPEQAHSSSAALEALPP
jgi:hypothetical protein